MATPVINSLKKKKIPKAPKMNSSKAVWDRYEKKRKEVDQYNKMVEKEKERRIKLRQR